MRPIPLPKIPGHHPLHVFFVRHRYGLHSAVVLWSSKRAMQRALRDNGNFMAVYVRSFPARAPRAKRLGTFHFHAGACGPWTIAHETYHAARHLESALRERVRDVQRREEIAAIEMERTWRAIRKELRRFRREEMG